MSLATMCDRSSGTLKRKTNTKDASGGMTMTFVAVGTDTTDVPCDIQPATGRVQMQYMQQQLQVSHTVFTETEVAAKAGDLWIAEGRTFQFVGREMPAPGYDQWGAKMHVLEQLG